MKQAVILKRKAVILLHVLIPILLGAVIYAIVSPDVLFVKKLEELTGWSLHFFPGHKILIIQFIRNYFLDMLWAYALFFAFFFIIGDNTAGLRITCIVTVICVVVMEVLQLTPFVSGTFDMWDIFVELLAAAIAVFIINKYFRRILL